MKPLKLWKATQKAVRKTFVLEGRASREEFWCFFFALVIAAAMSLSIRHIVVKNQLIDKVLWEISYLGGIIVLPLFLFSLSVRRLHDINYSSRILLPGTILMLSALLAGLSIPISHFFWGWGKWDGLFLIIPLYLMILGVAMNIAIMMIFALWPGNQQENQYGPPPKELL